MEMRNRGYFINHKTVCIHVVLSAKLEGIGIASTKVTLSHNKVNMMYEITKNIKNQNGKSPKIDARK